MLASSQTLMWPMAHPIAHLHPLGRTRRRRRRAARARGAVGARAGPAGGPAPRELRAPSRTRRARGWRRSASVRCEHPPRQAEAAARRAEPLRRLRTPAHRRPRPSRRHLSRTDPTPDPPTRVPQSRRQVLVPPSSFAPSVPGGATGRDRRRRPWRAVAEEGGSERGGRTGTADPSEVDSPPHPSRACSWDPRAAWALARGESCRTGGATREPAHARGGTRPSPRAHDRPAAGSHSPDMRSYIGLIVYISWFCARGAGGPRGACAGVVVTQRHAVDCLTPGHRPQGAGLRFPR